MIQFIFHIADIHIGSWGKGESRFTEYESVFARFGDLLSKYEKTKTLVVIAGDLFHYKDKYSGNDIVLFKALMSKLAGYKTIIIPGNHDLNMRNEHDNDLISPILDTHDVIFRKTTEIFEVSGVRFHHISMFDEEAIACDNAENTILLYHGGVDGAKFGTHTVRGSRISLELMKKYRLVMLGDIHGFQFINPTIAYCGSLIQQNVAESREKGCIIWNLNTRSGQFMQIANDCGLVRFDFRGKTEEECSEIVANTIVPKNVLKVSVVSDSHCVMQQVKAVEARFGKVSAVNQVAQIELNPNKDILDTLGTMLDNRGVSSEIRQEIILAHEKTLCVQTRSRWTVLSLEWSNILKYGNNTSKIDFTTLNGAVSGIVGENCLGKSSIIDILVYALFAELMRDTKESFMHLGAKQSFVRVVICVNGTTYNITRRENKIRHSSTVDFMKVVYKDGNAVEENAALGATGIIDVNRQIRAIIGTKEQFLATSIYYFTGDDVLRADSVKRMNVLSALFGMVDQTNTIKSISAERKEIDNNIRALAKPRSENSAELIANKQAELNGLRKHYSELIAKQTEIALAIRDVEITMNGARCYDVIAHDITDITEKIASEEKKIENIRGDIEIDVQYAEPVIVSTREHKLATEYSRDPVIINKEIELLQSKPVYPKPITSVSESQIAKILDEKGGDIAENEKYNIKYNDTCECCAHNRNSLQKVFGDAKRELRERAEQMQRELNQYNIALGLYIESEKNKADLVKLKTELNRANDIQVAIEKISNNYRYEQYQLRITLESCEKSIQMYRNRNIELHDELERSKKTNTTEYLQNKRIQEILNKNIIITLQNIGGIEREINHLKEDAEIARIYNEKHAEYSLRYNKCKVYEECLKSHSLKITAISKTMKSVVESVNVMMADICDFKLDYDIGENKVDLLCVERNGLRKPVSAASGFQMAIIAICFRLTLTSILTNTAEFIILDEPLQCVHSSNVGKIQEMLALMPSLYKFVFIISHTEALTDTIEVPIKIQVMRDGSSFIGENSPENNAIEGVLKQTNACGSNDQVEQADQTERVEQADHIHCHVCNKTVKKKSYQQHLKSAAHLKKQPNI